LLIESRLTKFYTDIEQVLNEKKPFILTLIAWPRLCAAGEDSPMAKVHVERLDHLGVLASIIKDLGLIDRMNARLVPDPQEVLTPGEAMAGMMLNGLGFAHRPLSLTPQFFASQPLDRLFHDGIRAEMFNRFKLGRPLEEAYAYGCDLLLHELALCVCARDGIDLRFNHLDTTSFSLTGEYVPDSDEQAMTITPGYSRD
jgi:transposase